MPGRLHSGATACVVRLVVAALLLVVSTPSPAIELAAVLERVRVSPPARVAFSEERHNRMLREPLVLTGYLEYLGAGHLRKVVEEPFRETFVVAGGRIEVTRGGRVETVPLTRSRTLQTMLRGVEALLAGEGEVLESLYDCALSGTADAWAMQLKPRSRRVSRHLESLHVTGDDTSVTSIRFDLEDGEWHVLTIRQTDADG